MIRTGLDYVLQEEGMKYEALSCTFVRAIHATSYSFYAAFCFSQSSYSTYKSYSMTACCERAIYIS